MAEHGKRESVLVGLDALRRDNPWPEFDWNSIEPEYFSLDAGGRELVIDRLQARDSKYLIEVGCFLCGSTRQWLEAKLDLTVIGIDPWDGNWSPYISSMEPPSSLARHLDTVKDVATLVQNVRRFGNYTVALNNVRAFRDRFIPVRQWSPAALEYLARRQIPADVIYIDAFKRLDDVEAACRLFPNAIVCGDDWNWRNEQGELQMQQIVVHFAQQAGYSIVSDRATWVLEPV